MKKDKEGLFSKYASWMCEGCGGRNVCVCDEQDRKARWEMLRYVALITALSYLIVELTVK